MKPFFQLHNGLMREGPGTADDVAWALEVAKTPKAARMCDAGCGPGTDAVTLAKLRPAGTVHAIDTLRHFCVAARSRLSHLRERATVEQGDMAQITGPYDLIWSAGALYFIGVTEGLNAWVKQLAPGGRIAFSEPVLLRAPTEKVSEFWAEYPEITNYEGIVTRVRKAGCRVLDHRMIVGQGWANYYDPMQARINLLRPTASPELIEALDAGQWEIDQWRSAPEEFAYALLVVEPT
ncbi:class I SAM-dependent methyltransferase [Oceaniglobus ichthyenteri]|uniref:class I SAM-dependent methyltransferase n=1 Tax=Oceaniglobus ichthyenteri TaxID=2136177 RepID=UPI000D38B7FB|nr:class I SAM-dependent methyltransferase [Oceaniglobus ichthyenteri]